jgi:hypothetical protein
LCGDLLRALSDARELYPPLAGIGTAQFGTGSLQPTQRRQTRPCGKQAHQWHGKSTSGV